MGQPSNSMNFLYYNFRFSKMYKIFNLGDYLPNYTSQDGIRTFVKVKRIHVVFSIVIFDYSHRMRLCLVKYVR